MDSNPDIGVTQPDIGVLSPIALKSMPRPPLPPKPPKDALTAILIENLKIRLKARFPQAKNPTEQLRKLKEKAGPGAETVRKIIRGEQTPRLDTLQRIAEVFAVGAWELLKPAQAETTTKRRDQEGGPFLGKTNRRPPPTPDQSSRSEPY